MKFEHTHFPAFSAKKFYVHSSLIVKRKRLVCLPQDSYYCALYCVLYSVVLLSRVLFDCYLILLFFPFSYSILLRETCLSNEECKIEET